jgi:trigger factor
LEVKVNEISTSENEIEVTMPYDEIKSDIENEVKKQTKNIQMPGFRKGKIPPAMIKKMYGDALEYEASEKVANSSFWKIVKDKNLQPIGQPVLKDIKFNPGEDFQFKVQYEILPQLDIKGYKDMEIEIPDFQVKGEEVEHEILHIKKANATQVVEEKIGDDRNYIIKLFLQRINDKGENFEGSKPETLDVDLSNEGVNKEIVENSKGKKVGETFEFTFTDERKVKNDKGEEENVKENFLYRAEIKEIKKNLLPELNEEFIKKVTNNKVENENDFRENIKNDIQKYYDQKVDEITRERLMQEIVKANDFTPPASLVTNFLNDFIDREEQEYKKQGYKKYDREEAAKRLKNYAVFEVKWYLIKAELEKKENIDVTDDDLQELVKKDAEKTGLPEDKLLNYYKSSNFAERLKDQKLFKFLEEHNKINKVDPSNFTKPKTEEDNDKTS